MEEKKSDNMHKRIETLKWVLQNNGVTEETIENLVEALDNSMKEKQIVSSIDDAAGSSMSTDKKMEYRNLLVIICIIPQKFIRVLIRVGDLGLMR